MFVWQYNDAVTIHARHGCLLRKYNQYVPVLVLFGHEMGLYGMDRASMHAVDTAVMYYPK
jgi:hypothetical protein